MMIMKPTYQQTEPLKYFTYVYKGDATVRFQYLTDDEIKALKEGGAIEVDIKNFKGVDDA